MPLLPLHTESRAMPTTPLPQLMPSPKSFGDTLTVMSSSGESSTLTALCMCTDYSSSPLMMPLGNGHRLVISGVSFLSDSGGLRCLRCKKMRPSRLTSASTA